MRQAKDELRYLEYLDRIQAAIDAGRLRCVFCRKRLNPKPRVIDPNHPKFKDSDPRLAWRWELARDHVEALARNVELQPGDLGYFKCEKCAAKFEEEDWKDKKKIRAWERKHGMRVKPMYSVPLKIKLQAGKLTRSK
jgi:hypothetical protein